MLAPFSPIIPERHYRARDVTRLLDGAEPLDFGLCAAVLRPAPAERLAALDAMPAGAPRRDSVVVAAAVGLWNSAEQSSALVAAARSHFLAGMERARSERKEKLPVLHFFRFLNKLGVDVLVLSENGERGLALFARKRRMRSKDSQADAEDENATEEKEAKEERESSREASGAGETLKVSDVQDARTRTLLVLEYDEEASLWCALRLALHPARKEIVEAEVLRSSSASPNNFGYTRTNAELTGTSLEKEMFEQTVYNPQHVRHGEAEAPQTADVVQDPTPFGGMKYPTITPMDCQLCDLFCRGLDPALRRNRLRFLLSAPAALLAAALGTALAVSASARHESCCFDEARNECAPPATCADFCAVEGANSAALREAPRAFLFGVSGPGRMAVAVVCCLFAAAAASVAVALSTARTVAIAGARPRFAFVAMGAQALLCTAACGIAAYNIAVFATRRHHVPCSAFSGTAFAECEALAHTCKGLSLQVAERSGPLRVALALGIALLTASVAALATSLIPSMPRDEEVARMQKAVPVTNTFYPSLYAPDGITAEAKDALRWRIKRQLRAQLRHEVNQSDVLLTRSATIGEMMRTNYEWSLKGYLARVGRSSSVPGQTNREVMLHPLHYMREEFSESELYATRAERIRPLSPRLAGEVRKISARVSGSKRSHRGRDAKQRHPHETAVLCESPKQITTKVYVNEEME